MPQHVVVIGGGIVGVSTGIWLRRQGIAVTVIDRLGWGKGTSHGNGGVLAACAMVPVTGPGLLTKAPGMLLNLDYPLFLKWGYLPKLTPWLLKYLGNANDADMQRIADGVAPIVTDAVDQHLSLSKNTRATSWVVESLYSYAYASRAAFDADAYSWAIRVRHGFEPTLREGDEARAFEPNFGPEVGFFATMGNHGYITDPGGYVAALGAEFEALGGTTVVADVKDVVLTDGAVSAVDTDQGRFACTELVLATGAWSKPLMKKLGIDVPLETERGYHIVFKNAQGGPSHPVMIASGKFVATPMAEGLRCAGIVEFGGLDAAPSKAPFDLLRRQTKAAFPNLTWDDEIEWQGHRPAPSDSLPLIGQIRNTGVYAGFGHHHIGLTGGPKTGRILAQLISGQRPNLDLTPYAPTRFA
ncbi:FAD-binding oxidoreductase [Marivita sp. S6314]|nr:FAD-binding oxidoreductase [Marivita sp. S6314]MCK0149738.1 FAD-binding oxidoreductase [Marivita sp. S6314]